MFEQAGGPRARGWRGAIAASGDPVTIFIRLAAFVQCALLLLLLMDGGAGVAMHQPGSPMGMLFSYALAPLAVVLITASVIQTCRIHKVGFRAVIRDWVQTLVVVAILYAGILSGIC